MERGLRAKTSILEDMTTPLKDGIRGQRAKTSHWCWDFETPEYYGIQIGKDV